MKLVALTLLLTLLVSGCASLTNSRPELPPRPLLESSRVDSEGGICINRADTAELMLYIEALERR